MSWKDEQQWESLWWGKCSNTYWEETKQIVYARKIGLHAEHIDGKYPVYDMKGISILDIGGGPVSILLKCINFSGSVVDPCEYPNWVHKRYDEIGIKYIQIKGEDIAPDKKYDEVWIYNVLQHTDNPEKIIKNARRIGKLIRIFEWIDVPIVRGHPHTLREDKLNKWLNGIGKTEHLNENGCMGRAYYGIFPV